MTGCADVRDAVDPAAGALDIDLDLRFVFNDIADPNKHYAMDTACSVLVNLFTAGQTDSYRLAISWGSKWPKFGGATYTLFRVPFRYSHRCKAAALRHP